MSTSKSAGKRREDYNIIKKEENFWNNYDKLNKPFYTTDPKKIIPKSSVPAPLASNNNSHNYRNSNYDKLNKPFYTTDPKKIIPTVPAPLASNNNRHNYYQYTAPSFYKTPDGKIGRDNKPGSMKVEVVRKPNPPQVFISQSTPRKQSEKIKRVTLEEGKKIVKDFIKKKNK